jgi:hypothetical protein
MTMKTDHLSDDEVEATIRQTVHDLEQSAFLLNLGVVMGTTSAERAKQAADVAKGAKREATKRKIAGPFLTPDEKQALKDDVLAGCERAWLDAVMKKAGGDADADPSVHEKRKERLEALDLS